MLRLLAFERHFLQPQAKNQPQSWIRAIMAMRLRMVETDLGRQ